MAKPWALDLGLLSILSVALWMLLLLSLEFTLLTSFPQQRTLARPLLGIRGLWR